MEAIRVRNRKCTTQDDRRASIDSACRSCSYEQSVTAASMAEYLGVAERCVRNRWKECKGGCRVRSGTVGKIEKTGKTGKTGKTENTKNTGNMENAEKTEN